MNNLEKIILRTASKENLLSKEMWRLDASTVSINFNKTKYTVSRNKIGGVDIYEDCATQNSLPLKYRRKILHSEKESIIDYLLSD